MLKALANIMSRIAPHRGTSTVSPSPAASHAPHGLAVDGGLGGLFGSLAEGFVIAGRGLGHTSTPLPRLHVCRAWMIEDAEMGYR